MAAGHASECALYGVLNKLDVCLIRNVWPYFTCAALSGTMGLSTLALIVSAHRYCARKFTCHVIHRARALSTKMNNDRVDGHCYSFACT